jgi:hypothetical protein
MAGVVRGVVAIMTAGGSDAKRGAGHAILFEQVLHTTHACASAKQHAETLLAAADTGEGLSVFPKACKMLIFFSRGDDGAVDPCSFHGGGATVGVEVADGKWVMQLCKELPFGARGRAAQATFVTARRRHALEYFTSENRTRQATHASRGPATAAAQPALLLMTNRGRILLRHA